jgi:hypothetical protein
VDARHTTSDLLREDTDPEFFDFKNGTQSTPILKVRKHGENKFS